MEKITPYIEQLVMNPFSGYRAEDRNILNPFIEETIKEWAFIDGAFVIECDGAVYSAGSRLTAVDSQLSLQSGLGTRHAAAAAISSVADCTAVCVSSSGQVTLFRHGEPIVLLDRSVSRTV
ncbi:MAG: DNA integrity scanning protein DisA nucleotide-binding domain protein [Opitutales bacterium]|nr:DNA integrity scanning protein DisA nucleotide-binding domain protein [Opitutales bacterium]